MQKLRKGSSPVSQPQQKQRAIRWDRVFQAAEDLNRKHLSQMAEDAGLTVEELQRLVEPTRKNGLVLS